MNARIFVVLFLASVKIEYGRGQCGTANYQCTAAADCTQAGILVPYPGDCEKYYACVGVGVYASLPLHCPDGTYFDTTNTPYFTCSPNPVGGSCSNDCSSCTVTTPIVQCAYVCDLRNPGTPAYVVDVSNNSIFYECGPAGPGPATSCPSGTCFDTSNKCNPDPSQCCSTCSETCAYPGYFQHPYVCTGYYYCTADKTDAGFSQCPTGNYFDENSGQCLEGTCTPKCTAAQYGGDGGGGETTTLPSSGCQDTNNYTCKGDGIYPYCDDRCDKNYIYCNGGKHIFVKCPGVAVFDPTTMQCVTDCSISK